MATVGDLLKDMAKRQAQEKAQGLHVEQGERTLGAIAREIRADWKKVNYAAEPYLQAMGTLYTVDDCYGYDDARSIVLYFLSNASSWRGPKARAIKAELKGLVR